MERQKFNEVTTEGSAGPPSGTKMSYQQLKQKFLRGNFENPSSLWAHDFGGQRLSEDPTLIRNGQIRKIIPLSQTPQNSAQ